LFDTSASAGCPERDPAAAERRARDAEKAATAKQQRSAFDLGDGVDAVALFRQAEACFQASGKGEETARSARQRADWVLRLTEQYATLRMRLRAALDAERPGEALVTLNELQALLARQDPGPYQRWLCQLRESLDRKVVQLNP